MSEELCDQVCRLFDSVCNLDCGVGILNEDLANCEVDIDCFADDQCINQNCRIDDICNEECGEGILTACQPDDDCSSFGNEDDLALSLGIGAGIFIVVMSLILVYVYCSPCASKGNDNDDLEEGKDSEDGKVLAASY